MPWLLMLLLAADTPELDRAAARLQGSAGRLHQAAASIAHIGTHVEEQGKPNSLGPATSDLVRVREQLAVVEQHVTELEAAIANQ